VATVVALTWNTAHAGWTGGVAGVGSDTSWQVGTRTSVERYRGAPGPAQAPRLDLPRLLTPRRTLFFTFGPRDPYGALVTLLEQARTDPEVAALVLEVEAAPVGAGRVEELRGLLAAVKARKPVLVYLTGGGTGAYWLASGATAVAMPPSSALMLTGFSASSLYLKDGLARLGVVVEVAKAGAYKSAPEPLTSSGPSPESREMTGSLLDSVSGRFTADVAAARSLGREQVAALVDKGLFTAADAKAAGLVDELVWPDELDAWASRLTGRPVKVRGGWEPTPARRAQRWGEPPAIAVVRLEGTIAAGQSRPEPLGDGTLAGAAGAAEALRRAAADRRVKAIVLRVESPGGDAQASDLVWRAVVQARRKKPVVVSMGDVAASGGYLAAVGADLIVAEPATITGSIGVFALKPDLSGLLEKLSLHRDAQRRGEVAELFSLTKPWTPAERAAVERMIDAVYQLFVDRVAEGRKLPRERVLELAGGRVWTGEQALERRLVDRLGGLPEAVAAARERAGIPREETVELLGLGGGSGLRLAGPFADALAGKLADALATEPPALVRAAAALPELRTAAVLAELGPVLALPMDWLSPGAGGR
jgi:protease-4